MVSCTPLPTLSLGPFKSTPALSLGSFKATQRRERTLSRLLPPVGGLGLTSPVPDGILPKEVLLYVPTPEEIKSCGVRMIFLNTPLEDEEQMQLKALADELKKQGKAVPPSMRIHMLRVLQHCHGNARRAIHQMEQNVQVRERLLPLSEDQVLDDLRKGALYWHGRDLKCRPCLVIRASRIDEEFFRKPDRICMVAIFSLEFMIRYGLCPGRVENWGVIVDLEHAGQHGVPPIRLITSLVNTLQGLYRFRMVWTKIINAPWWFAGLWSALKKAVPGESVKKVEILSSNYAESLRALLAPSQLERRYGGEASDLTEPADFFPIRCIPGPFSPVAVAAASAGAAGGPAEARESAPDRSPGRVDLRRLHELLSAEAHEGGLWARGAEATWLPRVADGAPLTALSVGYLKAETGVEVGPCESLQELVELLSSRRKASTGADELPAPAEPELEPSCCASGPLDEATLEEAPEAEPAVERSQEPAAPNPGKEPVEQESRTPQAVGCGMWRCC